MAFAAMPPAEDPETWRARVLAAERVLEEELAESRSSFR